MAPSPDRIKLTLQHKLLEYKQVEVQNSQTDAQTELKLQIADTKLYVPVVTLSKESDKKLLKQLKSGFKRTVKWNK